MKGQVFVEKQRAMVVVNSSKMCANGLELRFSAIILGV